MYSLFEIQHLKTCAMHQEINTSRHEKGSCMRISASWHAF